METETLIIGGGLSGLSLAKELTERGQDFLLVEARDRVGGRILSKDVQGAQFDLGPAWFWPGQPRIAALVAQLGLQRFDQYASGELSFEDERGQVQRGYGFSSMRGSWRLAGGIGALITALAQKLPQAQVKLSTPIIALAKTNDGVVATTNSGADISAKRVVLALPPRIAANIAATPDLSPRALQDMNNIATWMAGQAKIIAVYGKPFWRDAGLSGDAMSRLGPMVEIHDASPASGGPYALFGFVGVPPHARSDVRALKAEAQQQLVRLFGPQAQTPVDLMLYDWAFDPHTATSLDHQPLYAHPHYGLPHSLQNLWEGALVLAGTEVAPQFGGYLEGALEAAENALRFLELESA